jgi:hypothetical protein
VATQERELGDSIKLNAVVTEIQTDADGGDAVHGNGKVQPCAFPKSRHAVLSLSW